MSEVTTNILNEDNLKIYLAAYEVPPEAQKPIKGGRLNNMTAIVPQFRIKILTKIFGAYGVGWYVESVSETIQKFEETGETLVRAELNLYTKIDGEWSKPAPGVGSAKLVAIEKGSPRLDDEAFKKARTDAFGACSQWIGVGGSVYWQGDPGGDKYQDNSYNNNNASTMATKKDIEDLVNDAKALGFNEANVATFFGVRTVAEIKTTSDGIKACREAMKQSR